MKKEQGVGIFGELKIQDSETINVIWEKEIIFNNKPIEACLWVSKESFLTQENLDKMTNFIQNIEKFDRISREKIIDYLEEDNYFFRYHIDEIETSDIINDLGENSNIESFVNAMSIEHLSLWEDGFVIFDYMIDSENSDQILAVKFDIDGNFQVIDWES